MVQRRKRQQQRRRPQTSPVVATSAPLIPVTEIEAVPSAPVAGSTTTARSPVRSVDGFRFIQRDLIRVLVVLMIVSAVLVALLFTNEQTSWLDRIADTLYRWLRLG